jgi:phosphoglycerate dehydrogenase-like enzyme
MADVIVLFNKTPQIPLEITEGHLAAIREAAGGRVDFFRTEEDLLASGLDAEILVTWGQYKPVAWCGKSKKLKWIFALSAGVEGLVTTEIGDMPIEITNAQGIHGLPMTDTILGFILCHTRGFHYFLRNQREHVWRNEYPLGETVGKTVLILGAGKIGTEVAKRCKAFQMKTIGVGARDIDRPYCDVSRSYKNIADVLPEADFVVILVPINQDTFHLVNADTFAKMKRTAVVINCGRGAVVDEKAMVAALRDGVIGGAALDALETEPLPEDSPLWDMDNVIITPHCAATSPAYVDRAIGVFLESIPDYLAGKPVRNRVGGKG